MRNLGLKMWSTNVGSCSLVKKLYRQGCFKFIELFVVPGSGKNCLSHWKGSDIPYVLHAPHFYAGLNFADGNNEQKNGILIEEVEMFREALQPTRIIFHPGINGSIDETIKQIKSFRQSYQDLFNLALIENKPKVGLNGEDCVGASPDEIEKCIMSAGLGFCLDIGHAIYYAKWAGLDYKGVINSFHDLKPSHYHISNGDVGSMTDMHLNFADGNFDLRWIVCGIPGDAHVTIETERRVESDFSDFIMDVEYFRKMERRADREA